MKISICTAALAGLLMATGAASAATVVFDNTSGHPGGTLTFGTTPNSSASLANAVIDLVTRIDGSVISYPVTSSAGFNCGSPTTGFGCLNFTTGDYMSQSTTGNTTTYMYSSGGFLSINGTADGASGTLFSNTGFDSNVTLSVNNTTGLASLSATLKAGSLNSTLAAALGVSTYTPGGTDTNSSINVTFKGNTGTGTATTNSVQLNAAAVPEPGSIMLMSSGLLGVVALARRRMKLNA